MKKIAIMTDTNSGILPYEAEKNGIFMLQMPFIVDGEEFFDYGSMEYSEFFARMGAGATVSTSQPSPAALCEMWERILKSYESVIYLPMSSGLSGTCATAKAFSAEYEGRVFVVDNKRISVTLNAAVYDALYLRDKGFTAAEVTEKLESNALSASIYITVNTLEYLKKSGRVTSAGAAIGSLLGIKPVLQIQGEKLDAFKKVRGIAAAKETMLEAVKVDLETRFYGKKLRLSTAFSGSRTQGEEWCNAASEYFPDYEIELDALPVSISCHLGPGALGIGICEVEKAD